MARKKTTKTTRKSRASTPSLASMRASIDKLDRELLKLCNNRAKMAIAIGKLKDDSGQDCYAPGREEEVLGKISDSNKGPLQTRALRSIFRELISGSRSLERDKALRVAYLDPPYSFSHLASLEKFGDSVTIFQSAASRLFLRKSTERMLNTDWFRLKIQPMGVLQTHWILSPDCH